MSPIIPDTYPVDAGTFTGPFVIYQIHIDHPDGRKTYTGRSSTGTRRPAEEYTGIVRRLLDAAPCRTEGGYRAVHFALAAAAIRDWPVQIRLIDEAADLANLPDLERTHRERVSDEARLNGSRERAFITGCREVIAGHLRNSGHAADVAETAVRIQRSGLPTDALALPASDAKGVQHDAVETPAKPVGLAQVVQAHRRVLAKELGVAPEQIDITIRP